MIVGKEAPYLTLNISHYMNESLTPNCMLKKRGVYAVRDISVGEELTLHYGKTYPRTYTL